MTSLSPVDTGTWAGASWPLGAHIDPADGTTTFAVAAPRATRVTLEFFPAARGADAELSVPLAVGGDCVWRARVAGARHGTLYGFRVWGANWPHEDGWTPGSVVGWVTDRDEQLNHFNPNKVLFDPYALEVTHNPMSVGTHQARFGSGPIDVDGCPGRTIDTAHIAPKGVVIEDDTDYGAHPRHPEEDNAIYEAHVKNLTLHPYSARLGDLLAGVPGFERLPNVPD